MALGIAIPFPTAVDPSFSLFVKFSNKTLSSTLKFLLANQFVGSRYRIGDESNTNKKAKSYNLYNAAVNYKLNDIDISFNINNILDKKHYHYETSGGVYPLPELNWALKFKYLF